MSDLRDEARDIVFSLIVGLIFWTLVLALGIALGALSYWLFP